MPKGAHLTIGCYDHQQRTKRATRLRGAHRARLKPRLATVASLQHVSTILSLALNSWGSGSISMTLRQNHTFSSLDAEANAQVALWAVLDRRGDIPRLLAHRLSG